MSKKIITTAGTEFAQNGADLAMIEQTQRAGKPVMISSTDLNEGFSNAEADVKALVGFDVEGEEITVDPTTSKQTKTPSKGKNAITKVTVNAVTSAIDANIVAENIKKDVTILGVTGTHEGGSPVPEKVALDQQHNYTAIHFITEGYTTTVSNEVYAALEELIGGNCDSISLLHNYNTFYAVAPYVDSPDGYLIINAAEEQSGTLRKINLSKYRFILGENNSVTVEIANGFSIDKITTKQGETPYHVDPSSDSFDIDVLNLIAYAYTDEVVTPTPTVGE